jgi:hypothetical protein
MPLVPERVCDQWYFSRNGTFVLFVMINYVVTLKALAQTDADGHRNYWTDACLAKAAANRTGTSLDFYQIHTYPNNGGFDSESPFASLNKSHYGVDKPLVIGTMRLSLDIWILPITLAGIYCS